MPCKGEGDPGFDTAVPEFTSYWNFQNIADSVNSGTVTVDSTTDIWTRVGHGYITGASVRLTNSGGALPTGAGTGTYYVERLDADSFKLHTSYTNAMTSSASFLNVSNNGTGTHTVSLYEKTITDNHGFANMQAGRAGLTVAGDGVTFDGPGGGWFETAANKFGELDAFGVTAWFRLVSATGRLWRIGKATGTNAADYQIETANTAGTQWFGRVSNGAALDTIGATGAYPATGVDVLQITNYQRLNRDQTCIVTNSYSVDNGVNWVHQHNDLTRMTAKNAAFMLNNLGRGFSGCNAKYYGMGLRANNIIPRGCFNTIAAAGPGGVY